jgi:hypothetical protein
MKLPQVFCILIILAVVGTLLTAEPPAKPDPPTPTTPSALSTADTKRLNDLESLLKSKSDARTQAAAQYQKAVIEEQGVALQLNDQIRVLERMQCGAKEALSKTETTWKCLKIEPEPAGPAPVSASPPPNVKDKK